MENTPGNLQQTGRNHPANPGAKERRYQDKNHFPRIQIAKQS